MRKLWVILILAGLAAPAIAQISTISRYKTWGREVLTSADLNALQDHVNAKINELVTDATTTPADFRADTLTALQYARIGGIQAATIDTLTAYADSGHTHHSGDLIAVTGSGSSTVLSNSPNLSGSPTINYYTPWHSGNDGSGSGLDADLIDGVAAWTAANDGSGSGLDADLIDGYQGWNTNNDGAGSGLDADLLDGSSSGAFAVAGSANEIQYNSGSSSHSSSSDFTWNGTGVGVGTAASYAVHAKGAASSDGTIAVEAPTGYDAYFLLREGAANRGYLFYDDATDRVVLNRAADATDGIQIASNGYVGIESAPDGTNPLKVNGDIEATGLIDPDAVDTGIYDFGLIKRGAGNAAIGLENSAADNYVIYNANDGIRFYTIGGSGSAVKMTVTNTGVAVMATSDNGYELYVAGDGYASGTFTWLSDERFKAVKDTLANVLPMLRDIPAVRYTPTALSPNPDKEGTHIGIGAQTLQRRFPELVTTAEDSTLGVQYAQLSAVLLQAVRELDANNQHLEFRLAAVEQSKGR